MIQTTLFPDTFRQIFSLSNDEIASIFEQVSDLLEAQGDDYYRIRAYRKGAQSVRRHPEPVVDIFETQGTEGLEQLPYIGKRLAGAIAELATTGEFGLLERLSIDVSPEDIFITVPGIGQVLARRIYKGLDIETLEGLEQAAHDGTLEQMPGFGSGRIALVRNALATMLNRTEPQTRNQQQRQQQPQLTRQKNSVVTAPSVELLLAVDEQYRYLAKAGQLRMVTPKRFNPEGRRWLPVMELSKGGWIFDVMYSNTARAHELKKTNDWVVVSYRREGDHTDFRGQCTVVTESRGPNRGQRVVRGEGVVAA